MAERKEVYEQRFGLRRSVIFDPDNPNNFIIHTEQRLDEVIDNNRIYREIHPRRSDFKLLARGVPLTVYEQSIREQWGDGDWKKWLNDPANRDFRIWEGKV